MSQQLINRSPDLKALRDMGMSARVENGYLIIQDIPYVDSSCTVKTGVIVSQLDLAGDQTRKPISHVVFFQGDYPCNMDGSPIEQIRHQSKKQEIVPGFHVDYSFSNKPKGGYADYKHKMTTYINIISSPAKALEPEVTERIFAPVIADKDNVFVYEDTNASRANIANISTKLKGQVVAIIGLGGTGSYVLDLVAKTHVDAIHIYDGDELLQHNIFRSPGAVSLETLQKSFKKVHYYKQIYDALHRNIISHPYYFDSTYVSELDDIDFVFLCSGDGHGKKEIVDILYQHNIPFIDVGMGLQVVNDSLLGVLRVTAGTEDSRSKLNDWIGLSNGTVDDPYSTNIQIAELNALNACLAVIKWKKMLGFYHDQISALHSTFTLDTGEMTND